MEQDFNKLNIILSFCWVLFVLPLTPLFFKEIYLSENLSMVLLLVSMLFGFLYYVALGITASKKNRSVIKWVGLSIIFAPFGTIFSFPLMLSAKPLPRKE